MMTQSGWAGEGGSTSSEIKPGVVATALLISVCQPAKSAACSGSTRVWVMMVIDAPETGAADATEAMSSPERRHRATQHYLMTCHFLLLAIWLLTICSFLQAIVNTPIERDWDLRSCRARCSLTVDLT